MINRCKYYDCAGILPVQFFGKYVCLLLFAVILCSCGQTKNSKTSHIVGNDRDVHDCIASAGYTWSEIRGECIRLFEKGIRLEEIDGEKSIFVVFDKDSLHAELFLSDGRHDILDGRILPEGGREWSLEEDNAMTVGKINDIWTVSQRGKVIYTEELLPVEEQFQGKVLMNDGLNVIYDLDIKHAENSGDGIFTLVMTYPAAQTEDEKSVSVSGRRYTLRGDAYDDNAVVWQFVPDDGSASINFLVVDSATLVLLDNDFKKINSKFDTIKLKN